MTLELGAVQAPCSPMGALGPLLAGIEVGLRLGGFGPPLPTLNAPIDSLLASPSLWGQLSCWCRGVTTHPAGTQRLLG